MSRPFRILALGDSYTIGEGVERIESFPFQLTHRLNTSNFSVEEPVVIAQTGWSTSDLLKALHSKPVTGKFDLVFLLIGVNNQYQGLSIEKYRDEFAVLSEMALDYVNGIKDSVFILSIPDYSFTPFAEKMDKKKIRKELSEYNLVSKEEALRKAVNYINITDLSTGGLEDPELLTEDNLHPSGKMYRLWVERIVNHLISRKDRKAYPQRTQR